MSSPALTVVVITGKARDRIARLLDALAGQSIAGALEVVIVSLASSEPGIDLPGGLDAVVANHPGSCDLGRARAEGVRRARAPLIAFLEDHTVPESRWAEQVCRTFQTLPLITAVSYAFVNGSPDTYFYRSVFMAEYGALAHPLPEGGAPAMAANNVAYRREALTAFGAGLDALIEIDYFLQKAMGGNFQIAAAPLALLAHQTNRRLRDLVRGHFLYAQLFAHRRLQFERWSLPKRVVAAAAVPLLVPLLRIERLFQALAGGPNVSRAATALPVILILYLAGALGEAWGLLHGKGPADSLVWLELESERIAG